MGSYEWLYPRAGGCAIYRLVTDYAEELKAGYSMYQDGRDFDKPVMVPIKVEVTGDDFTCPKCQKVSKNKVGNMAHQRFCKG